MSETHADRLLSETLLYYFIFDTAEQDILKRVKHLEDDFAEEHADHVHSTTLAPVPTTEAMMTTEKAMTTTEKEMTTQKK